MFCTKCGKEIKDTSKFCPYCGLQIVNEEKEVVDIGKTNLEEVSITKEDTNTNQYNRLVDLSSEVIPSKEVKTSTFNIPSLILLILIIGLIVLWNIGGFKLDGTYLSFNELFKILNSYKDLYDVSFLVYINFSFYFLAIILSISCLFCFLTNKAGKLNRILIFLFGLSILALFSYTYLKYNNILNINFFNELNIYGLIYIILSLLTSLFSLICLIIKK